MTSKLLTVPATVGVLDTAAIAEESCRIVGAAGFYPERKVGADYVERSAPVIERQLVMAGARLAAVFNKLIR